MKLPFCPYEEKVAELLRRNSFPASAEHELVAHVETCNRCHEIMFINQIFQQGRSKRMLLAHTNSPHYLWWMAQLRLKNSNVERITKPIAWAEKLAFGFLICTVVGLGFWQWQPFSRWIGRLSDSFGAGTLWNAAWLQFTAEHGLLGYSIIAGIAIITCIGGLTLLMFDEKE